MSYVHCVSYCCSTYARYNLFYTPHPPQHTPEEGRLPPHLHNTIIKVTFSLLCNWKEVNLSNFFAGQWAYTNPNNSNSDPGILMYSAAPAVMYFWLRCFSRWSHNLTFSASIWGQMMKLLCFGPWLVSDSSSVLLHPQKTGRAVASEVVYTLPIHIATLQTNREKSWEKRKRGLILIQWMTLSRYRKTQ